jgi:hypothetical protein
MFAYTHVPADLTVGSSYSASYSQVFFPGNPAEYTASSFETNYTSIIAGSAKYFSSKNQGAVTEIYENVFSYPTGTRPRSVTQETYSATFSTNLTIPSVETVVTSYSTTGEFYSIGHSTGVDSYTYTFPSTSSAGFTRTWLAKNAKGSSTTLSATGTQVTTTTGAQSATIPSATTLVPLFHNLPGVARWYVTRQLPPPLRLAAIAFGASHTSGTSSIISLSGGSHNNGRESMFGTSSSFDGVANAPACGDCAGNSSGTTAVFYTSARLSATSFGFSVAASRKQPVNHCFYSAGSFFSSIAYSPAVTGVGWTTGVPLAQNVMGVSIFTSPKQAGSLSYVWINENGSWRLRVGNGSTTQSVGVVGQGGIETTEQAAEHIIGATTAVLGPLIPFSAADFNVLSVTSYVDTEHTTAGAVFITQRNSQAVLSASTSIADSSSATARLGDASLGVASYANSLLTGLVGHVVFSVSKETQNTTGDAYMFHAGEAGAGDSVGLFRASKWVEAGMLDAVSRQD